MRGALTFLPLLATTILLSAVPASRVDAAGEVSVSMNNGHVTISAREATLRDILSAWARAGQTMITNLDQITVDAPVTLELRDVREEDALAVLLRPLSGYLTTRRTAPITNVSRYDRIVLLPTSVSNHDSAVINTPAPPPFTPPAPPQQPQRTVMINGVARLIGPNGALVEDDQVDAPPANAPRGFSRGDAPAVAPSVPGRPPAAPSATPSPVVVGSPTPGMVVNPPQSARPAPTPAQR